MKLSEQEIAVCRTMGISHEAYGETVAAMKQQELERQSAALRTPGSREAIEREVCKNMGLSYDDFLASARQVR